jgi:hypothetical protein
MAVNRMAIVPQKVILIMAFGMLDPPVFAAMAPNAIKKNKANPYRLYSMLSNGKNKATSKGKIPPTEKLHPKP